MMLQTFRRHDCHGGGGGKGGEGKRQKLAKSLTKENTNTFFSTKFVAIATW